MVTNFLINMVLGIFNALWSLIPSYTLDTSTITSFSNNAAALAGTFNQYFPVGVMAACLVLLLVVKVGLLVWKLLLMLYRLVPFNG